MLMRQNANDEVSKGCLVDSASRLTPRLVDSARFDTYGAFLIIEKYNLTKKTVS